MARYSSTLVAAVGLNPAKVFQTFCALVAAPQEKLSIDRLDLIGTKRSWEVFSAQLTTFTAGLDQAARHYHVPPPVLRFHLLWDRQSAHPITDLHTTEHHVAAWRQVFDIVESLVSQSDLVIGTFPGARKALTQAMILAFQLLARPRDRLVQVIVPNACAARLPAPASLAKYRMRALISDLPFLRVRELPATLRALDLDTLIAAVQPRLDDQSGPTLEFRVDATDTVLSVAVGNRILWPNHLGIRLRRRDLALWLYLARLRQLHGRQPPAYTPSSLESAFSEILPHYPPAPGPKPSQSAQQPLYPMNASTLRRTVALAPCPCCFREASELSAFVPERDRDLPDEYVRQAMSRIKRALVEFGLPMSQVDAIRFRGAGVRPNTAYGLHLDPNSILIRQIRS